MTSRLVLFMLICLTAQLQAQTVTPANAPADDTFRTLLHLKKIRKIGLYFAPEIQYAQFGEKEFTPASGMSAMFVLNQRFAFGMTGSMTMNPEFSPASVSPQYLRAAYGGLRMEWTQRPNKALHLSFPLVLGSGWANVDSVSFRRDYSGPGHQHNDDFNGRSRNHAQWFVIQPGVRVEANLLRYVKVFAGADYRLAFQDESITNVPENALRGMTATAGLKIGFFNFDVSRLRKKKQ